MAWRRYPADFIWREMDEMRAELDSMFRQMSAGGRFLPAGDMSDRMLPAIRGEFRVDVREHDDDVIVVADLPGIDKSAVSLQLLNPRALEISCGKSDERVEKDEGFSMRERSSGSMSRVIALPREVTKENAKASFRNGVLEVTLKKTRTATIPKIPIE